MILTGKNRNTRTGTCSTVTMYIANFTWTGLGVNKRSATNGLSNGTASCLVCPVCLFVHLFSKVKITLFSVTVFVFVMTFDKRHSLT